MAGRQMRRQIAGALVGAAMIFSGTAAALADNEIRPVSGPWEAGKFEFDKKQKKTRQALSGIACPGKPGSGSACLVVFDEGTVAHYVTLSPDGYTIDNTEVPLIDSDGELDAEAAATDGTFYYVTGSHSTKRGDCQSNPDSRHLIRFAVGADGKGIDTGGGLVGYKETGALWHVMKSRSELKDHVGKCLGAEQEGINIEGLAVKDGMLHVGFRAPTADGTVPVLSVDAKTVFESAEPPTQITMLRVGKGRGIRDLAAVHDGILVLAGPDDDDANRDREWILALWDGVAHDGSTIEPARLAKLDLSNVELRDCDKELKPEALAILKDDHSTLDVVVMSDGMCDGGPLKFSISR
jgi:Protein of unknown function (DUF3616)